MNSSIGVVAVKYLIRGCSEIRCLFFKDNSDFFMTVVRNRTMYSGMCKKVMYMYKEFCWDCRKTGKGRSVPSSPPDEQNKLQNDNPVTVYPFVHLESLEWSWSLFLVPGNFLLQRGFRHPCEHTKRVRTRLVYSPQETSNGRHHVVQRFDHNLSMRPGNARDLIFHPRIMDKHDVYQSYQSTSYAFGNSPSLVCLCWCGWFYQMRTECCLPVKWNSVHNGIDATS